MATLAATFLLGIWGYSECIADPDCPDNQYCFEVSGLCVNYTLCHRHNRKEAAQPARHPAQCGSCITGYRAEILANGDVAEICKKTNVVSIDDTDAAIPTWGIILISFVVVFATAMIIVSVFRLFKKRICQRSEDRSKDHEARVPMLNTPSAPPPPIAIEAPPGDGIPRCRPLDGNENPPSYLLAMNNNKILVDRNKPVKAEPFLPPDWVHMDPNYDNGHDSHDSQEESLSPPPVQPDDDTNPSTWTPQQPTDQVSGRPFALFATEQIDNDRNTALARGSCPPTVEIRNNGDDSAGGPSLHNIGSPPTDPGNSGGRRTDQIFQVNIISQVHVTNKHH